MALIKNNICVKICLHTNIQARKAALVRHYFSRRNIFCLNNSRLPSPSRSVIFDPINVDILPKCEFPINSNFHVSYSVSLPCFNMNGNYWALKMQSDISKVNTWLDFNICRRYGRSLLEVRSQK